VQTGKRTGVTVALTLAATLAFMVVGTAPGPGQAAAAPLRAADAPTGSPVLSAAAINTTAITATWTAPTGTVTNYTLVYARFYGVPIAYVSVGTATVYNLTGLGYGVTYYLTVWSWDGLDEGPPSNVAAVHTDPLQPVVPPFPWQTLDAITTLSILGSLAIAFAMSTYVAGRRARRAEGVASIALARAQGSAIQRRPSRPYGEVRER